MTTQQKILLFLSIALAISLAANLYFWKSSEADSNDDLIRSQQKEELLREQLSVQESKNDSLQVLFDAKKTEIDTFIIYKETQKQYYEEEKSNILVLDVDSSFSFFTNRLSKADTL